MKSERQKIEEFVRIKVELSMLKYANSVLIHECPQCKRRYAINQEKNSGVEEIINFIMEIYDGSESVKLYLLSCLSD